MSIFLDMAVVLQACGDNDPHARSVERVVSWATHAIAILEDIDQGYDATTEIKELIEMWQTQVIR